MKNLTGMPLPDMGVVGVNLILAMGIIIMFAEWATNRFAEQDNTIGIKTPFWRYN